MNKAFKTLVALSLSILFTACADQETQKNNEAIVNMSSCEKIQALIGAHKDQFKQIRYARQTTNRMDIWRTRYHLIGDRCQIWDWGSGNTDYVCSLIAPEQELAEQRYEKAKQTTRECLDSSWQLTEQARKVGQGSKAVYAQQGNNTVVATHVVKIRGLFNTEWITYYFVGDRNDQL